MLGSWFVILAATAGMLLVPAGAALLMIRPGRRAHVAAAESSTRVLHLLAGVTGSGLGGLATAGLLGQGPFLALATAVFHAVSVLAWARALPSWGVRGVVVWAQQFIVAVGLLGWLVHEIAVSGLSPLGLLASALLWLLVLIALVPVQREVRRRIELRAKPGASHLPLTGTSGAQRRQAVVSLAALAAGGVLVAAAAGEPVSPQDPTQAGRGDSPAEGTGGTRAQSPSGAPAAPASTERTGDTTEPDAVEPSGEARTSSDPTSTATDTATSSSPRDTTPSRASAPETADPEPAKTPGYEKEKPNRPPGRPSDPGGPKER